MSSKIDIRNSNSSVIIKGVIIKDKDFKDLKKPLDQWIRLIEQYSDHFDSNHDACYWYNERATLSTLAASFWKSKDWIALEEFTTEKIDAEGKKKPGRCDLYVSGPKRSYACEAKQAWDRIVPSADDPQEVLENSISVALDAAWEDIAKLQNDEANCRLALCFCVPSFTNMNDLDGEINAWLKDCREYNHVAFAYCFPGNTRMLRSKHPKTIGRIFPGVALIVQHRQRGNGKRKD